MRQKVDIARAGLGSQRGVFRVAGGAGGGASM